MMCCEDIAALEYLTIVLIVLLIRLLDLTHFLQPQRGVHFSLYIRQQFLILQKELGSNYLLLF